MIHIFAVGMGSFIKSQNTLFLLAGLGITLCLAPNLSVAEPLTRLNASGNQLALAPEEVSTDKSEQQQPTSRPPEVEVLRSTEDGAGYGSELHRVTITGTARNASGEPVKNAEIYIGTSASHYPSNFNLLRGQTRTDETGYYELKDIQLLVNRERPNPIPRQAEGGFVVFGTCDGYGFTWNATCQYRPDVRPQGTELGDKNANVTDQAFYKGEPIKVDLLFEPPAQIKGRITDKQGNPLANTKVQLGLVDSLRNPNSSGIRSCRFLGNENQPVGKPVTFAAVHLLPADFRETRTDAKGYYELTGLRRDTSYLTNIDPGPTFNPWQLRLATTGEQKIDNSRTIHVEYDGILNKEFDAPRQITVQVVEEKTGKPVADVLVTASPLRQIRRGGLQARSDSQGNALLQLGTGEYTLIAEPAPIQPFCFQEQKISIPEDTDEVQLTLKLKSAAIVKLKTVNAETGKPISGIRFLYETDSSSQQFPLSTQTVFVDYPQTNSAGELQAFVTPGRKRFIVAEPLTLAQAENSRGAILDLSGGEVAEVVFKLTPPQFLPDHVFADEPEPDQNSIYTPDLQLKWHHQSELLRNSNLQIDTQYTLIVRKPIDPDSLLKDLRALDPYQLPEIEKLLKQHQVENVNWSKKRLTAHGKIYREENYYSPEVAPTVLSSRDGTPLPQSINLTDGWYTQRYNINNSQADISRHSVIHIDSPYDLCNWPALRRRRTESGKTEKPEFNIHQEGQRTIYETKSERYSQRRVCDQETGFIFEDSTDVRSSNYQRVSVSFAPQKYANGLILPRMFLSWTTSNGKLRLLRIFKIEKVEIPLQLAADAFSIPLPPGTMIVDSRHIPRNASRSRPVRRIQTVLNGPVSDFAAYMQRHPPQIPKQESIIEYGKPAPELKVSRWFTSKGETESPDLKDKVVLIEFWGTRCGPCIAQLPEVRTAARYYADAPLVLIGIHDSYASVSDLQKFAKKENINYQLAIDQPSTEKGWFGQTMHNFGVRGIPHAAVIDQQGNLAYVGYFGEALRTVDRLLKDK